MEKVYNCEVILGSTLISIYKSGEPLYIGDLLWHAKECTTLRIFIPRGVIDSESHTATFLASIREFDYTPGVIVDGIDKSFPVRFDYAFISYKWKMLSKSQKNEEIAEKLGWAVGQIEWSKDGREYSEREYLRKEFKNSTGLSAKCFDEAITYSKPGFQLVHLQIPRDLYAKIKSKAVKNSEYLAVILRRAIVKGLEEENKHAQIPEQ